MTGLISTTLRCFKNALGLHAPEAPAPRLNLGCGHDYREGYVNIDLNSAHKVDLQSDVADLRAIADNSCTEVLAQDVLEHLGRHRSQTALREWNRVLQSGGALFLRVPSLLDLLGLLQHPDWQSYEQQKRLIQCLYGTQGYEGDFHLNGYTEITLRQELADAGFTITRLDVEDGWLFTVTAYKTRHAPPDPILSTDSDQAFLEQAYLRLLGREPDASGLQHYLALLAQGIDREAVLDTIAQSEESRHRHAPEDKNA